MKLDKFTKLQLIIMKISEYFSNKFIKAGTIYLKFGKLIQNNFCYL